MSFDNKLKINEPTSILEMFGTLIAKLFKKKILAIVPKTKIKTNKIFCFDI